MKNHTLRLGLLVYLAAGSFGCDPGIHYRPRHWTKVDAFHWRTVDGGISFTMRPIGGLIGETWLSPDIEAKNQATLPIAIESATLQCGHVSYPADSVALFSRADSSSPWVHDTKGFLAPGETRKLDLNWHFQEPISDVLHEPVSIVLKLKIGDDAQAVAIPMSRE